MLKRDHVFMDVDDPGTLGRLSRSADIRVLNRFTHFEARNARNGHAYKVKVDGDSIICNCPDSKLHACKHEIAVARDASFFLGVG